MCTCSWVSDSLSVCGTSVSSLGCCMCCLCICMCVMVGSLCEFLRWCLLSSRGSERLAVWLGVGGPAYAVLHAQAAWPLAWSCMWRVKALISFASHHFSHELLIHRQYTNTHRDALCDLAPMMGAVITAQERASLWRTLGLPTRLPRETHGAHSRGSQNPPQA